MSDCNGILLACRECPTHDTCDLKVKDNPSLQKENCLYAEQISNGKVEVIDTKGLIGYTLVRK